MAAFKSLRSKLTLVYGLTIVTPFVILAFVLPIYAQHVLIRETEKLTAGTLRAMAGNIETYLDDLERLTASPYLNDNVIQALKIIADNVYEHASAYTKLQTDRALTGTLPNYLINTRKDILSTLIITMNGKAYLTTKNSSIDLVPDFPFQYELWYQKAVKRDGKAAFISSHSQTYLTNPSNIQVFSVSRLIKNPESGQPLAVISADADTNVLDQITKDIPFNVSSVVAITDDMGNVIYSGKPLTEEMLKQLQTRGNEDVRNTGFVTVTQTIKPANWEITVFLSNDELKQKVHWIYITAALISIGGLIVTFFVFRYSSQWIVKPITQMKEVMIKVRNGNLQARYEGAGSDELSYLGHSLNKMVIQLDELINREYKAVLAQQHAEYRALQSQIQPHFLYNVLSGFIGLNRIGDTKSLETAILSLSGMLRYILEDNQWTTVEHEFKFLTKYALLQQLRFQDRLTIHIHYDDEAAECRIPKLLIQPLLENAVIHGIEPDDQDHTIHVSASIKQQDNDPLICIEVRDDGVGFDAKAMQSQAHVGLANVNSRLKLVYPNAQLSIVSEPHIGTCVTIQISKEDSLS
ncbi:MULTISPECIES: cache domain-containing sensor histidine kinase [Paenibacillus]|uniref:Sensor histidine kinase n=1 Tax=Paenibacillus alvei TaxID=44250 RepID=A0ABT4EAU6_PAEAL|nr:MULTISPECIES: sensor histidine kinase [Paenibacillus]EPY10400.1 sensor with HAMP domain [Paenibacillus alvei A6-6i-x]MCY9530850.1 sensor histidine kinase [Paenibacillus alvei]SDF10253.1 two-component system, sensor histidine kinase YesM [Paenibacillus sp. cl6col]